LCFVEKPVGRRQGRLVKPHKLTKLSIIVHKTVSKKYIKALNAFPSSSAFVFFCVNSFVFTVVENKKHNEKKRKKGEKKLFNKVMMHFVAAERRRRE
jgi:hypothetical protein